MATIPNAYDYADIKAGTRELLRSDENMAIEDIVRMVFDDLYEGEPCLPALINAIKDGLCDETSQAASPDRDGSFT